MWLFLVRRRQVGFDEGLFWILFGVWGMWALLVWGSRYLSGSRLGLCG